MARYHNDCHAVLKEAQVFPIEVDLSRSTFTYETANQFNDGTEDGEADGGITPEVEEAKEAPLTPPDGDLISTD